MKIRFGNYIIARIIFDILKFFWSNVLRKGIVFDEVTGRNYEDKIIDVYYLINVVNQKEGGEE